MSGPGGVRPGRREAGRGAVPTGSRAPAGRLPGRLPGRLLGQARGWAGGWVRLLLLLFLALPLATILAFRVLPVPVTPLMLIRGIQGYELHHDWVPYDAIAPSLAQAVIASEDNTFCTQALGFDFPALRGQVETLLEGERPRGASTITMQTAKNLMLWPGRDPVRKLLESWLTPQIALLWPRQRVLEVYLNIVEFGPGIYGAEAAARAFFNKPASALTLRESTQLAVVLPSPLHWVANRPSTWLRQRAATIRARIGELGPLLDCTR
ncbi:Monofunctional biosynthetic peptidoglycan transglycosylase [Roseomonas mucosa]|uniref:Biosynthetic peptidoglycan transglycosylase n=1 Tax=Roseomonas mucosa TaxID=207340 RepID=A0A379N0Q6_9PROT|nr:monofunctional biosynthetic peptidoglycan transglycosylase [Acetobacteraceae bacterium]QDD99551.1 Monofunctional biosynthetic peptidoglycan transglycosylase [Roseomonas mucosa]QET92502.1 monofunctional biosynthetic peptidoglycan transglycosylase [Roseomonas mucosa]UZO91845.1 Monofunctional biosynthetic peptidoglycan transglycosylase [Roseomonas mucosa]SUE40791.1 Penicillin-binding protein 4 precursor [Roseomonas mucosa]